MEQFLETAEPYYSSEIPYHNFSHVKDTLEAADELFTRCNEYGIEINEEIVNAALAFHDAFYHKDEQELGFDSKEDLSKQVAKIELLEQDYGEEFISEVENCIEATKPAVFPETNEEIAVRASDLRGLMGDYDEFIQNTEALRKEHKVLNGSEPDYEQWVEGVLNTLHHYASQDLRLTPEHDTEDGLSEFHSILGRNIGQFINEYVEDGMEIEVTVNI